MTEIATPPAVPPAVPPAPGKSAWERLAGVFFSPVETFEDIARRPDLLMPLAIIVIISIISTAMLVPKMDFESATRDAIQQSGQKMSEQDLDRAVRMGSGIGKTMAYFSPVFSIIILAIIAGVLLLAFRLLGGDGNFKQAFSASAWSWMPYLVSGIITTIVLATRRTVDPQEIPTLIKSNLGFLSDPRENPVAFTLLSSLDVFSIWSLVLLILGFAALSRFSRGKAAAIVVTLWIVQLLVRAGFAALGAAASAS